MAGRKSVRDPKQLLAKKLAKPACLESVSGATKLLPVQPHHCTLLLYHFQFSHDCLSDFGGANAKATALHRCAMSDNVAMSGGYLSLCQGPGQDALYQRVSPRDYCLLEEASSSADSHVCWTFIEAQGGRKTGIQVFLHPPEGAGGSGCPYFRHLLHRKAFSLYFLSCEPEMAHLLLFSSP